MVQTRNLYRKEDDEKKRPEAPPHIGGICLLGSVGEAEDLPLEVHQALVVEISSAKWDALLKKDFSDHLLQSSKYQLDKSLEEGSSRHISHEQMT